MSTDSTKKFKIGDIVRFRGVELEGVLIVAHDKGPSVFVAKVASRPYGICYALEWGDGTPVGIPFHDCTLKPANKQQKAQFLKESKR